MTDKGKTIKPKSTDAIKQVEKDETRRNRLNSIKNGLETQQIKTFKQIFAIMTQTRLSIETGISYNTFRNRVRKPQMFWVQDIMALAYLFGISYDTMHDFIINLIKEKNKSRIFKS